MIRNNLILFIVLGFISTIFAQDDILLKNYRPVSVYKVPKTRIEKAEFPVVDRHSHAWAKTSQEVESWVSTMDAKGIQKSIILSSATGAAFDSIPLAFIRFGTIGYCI